MLNTTIFRVYQAFLFAILIIQCINQEHDYWHDQNTISIYNVNQLYSSLAGGAEVVIDCEGQDFQNPDSNSVRIGPYDCILKEITEAQITCITTEPFDLERLSNLNIEITVQGNSIIQQNSYQEEFSYSFDYTPMIYSLDEQRVAPGNSVNIVGNQVNTNYSDDSKNKIKIGNEKIGYTACQYYNINYDSDCCSEYNNYYHQCIIDNQMEAGFYELKIETSLGSSINVLSSFKYTSDGLQKYQLVVNPVIQQLSQNISGSSGTLLKITGKGFGSEIENVQVKAGNLDCQVLSVKNNEIECEVEQGMSTLGDDQQTIGEQGIQVRYFNHYYENPQEMFEDIKSFKQAVEDKINSNNNQENNNNNYDDYDNQYYDYYHFYDSWSEQISSWYLNNNCCQQSATVSGYFQAPRTGDYNFWYSSNSKIAIYLNKTPGQQEIESSQDLIIGCNEENYNYNNNNLHSQWFQTVYRQVENCDFRSESISLQEGEYYWMEIYITNQNHDELFFSLSVETPKIPGLQEQPKNTVPNIKEYTISGKNGKNEIWSMKIWNYDQPFGIKLGQEEHIGWDEETNEELYEIQYHETEKYTWSEWTAQQLYGLPDIPEITTINSLDSSGQVCEDCEAAGIEIILEFSYQRCCSYSGENQQSPLFSNGDITDQQIVQTQTYLSAEITDGYYKLEIDGDFVPINEYQYDESDDYYTHINFIDINESSTGQLQRGIFRLKNEYNIDVYMVEGSEHDYSYRTYQLIFRDVSEEVELTFENQLTQEQQQGDELISATITQKNIVSPNPDRLLFDPIPYDLSFMPAISDQDTYYNIDYINNNSNNQQQEQRTKVQVTVNGINNSDNDNEAYDIQQKYFTTVEGLEPVISSFNLDTNNNQLQFELEEGSSGEINFEETEISVQFGFTNCYNYNGSYCSLLGGSDGVEGGLHKPKVMIGGIGFAKVTAAAKVYIPVIESISPNIGGVYGGIEVVINGSYFTGSKERAIVKIGENVAKIVSIQHDQIKIILPRASNSDQVGNQNVSVIINQQKDSSSQTFEYTNAGIPQITSISPESTSPVEKSTVIVTGQNFGTDKNDIEVYLLHVGGSIEDIAYKLYVRELTDTEITATLSGGRSEDYELLVFKKSVGESLERVNFSYKIEVNNVMPRDVGILGGAILTITGKNFSTTPVNNNVFITQGQERVNVMCTVQSSTETEIQCVVPPKKKAFKLNQPVLVYVQGRLIEEGVCNGTCDFNYSESITPVLDAQTQGGEVEISTENPNFIVNGINLPEVNTPAKIQFTQEHTLTGSVTSSTEISFTLDSEIPAGEYEALVSVGNLGYAGILNVKVLITFSSFTPQPLSNQGGYLTIQGTGFDKKTKVTISYDYNGDQNEFSERQQCDIQSVSFTEIICLFNDYIDFDDTNQYFVIQNGEVKAYQQFVPYDMQTSVQFIDQSTSVVADTDITIQITSIDNLDANAVVIPHLINKKNKKRRYTGVFQNTNEFFFAGAEIPVESYNIKVEIQGVGFVQQSPSDAEIVITQTFNIGNTETGLFGGNQLVINGKGFDLENLNNNQVKVCGFQCLPNSDQSTYHQLFCDLPVVSTDYIRQHSEIFQEDQELMIDQPEEYEYQPIEQVELRQQSVEFFADYPSIQNIWQFIKGNRNSHYESSYGDECYFGYNLGDDRKLKLSQIYITLPFSWGNIFDQGVLQISNDGTNWTDILEFGRANFFFRSNEYDEEDFGDVELFQYIRYYSTDMHLGCRISNFKVYGTTYYKEIVEDEGSFTCDVTVGVNSNRNDVQLFEGVVTYSGSQVSSVENILPYYGWQRGGTEVTISGQNFGTVQEDIEVYFDDIQCVVNSVSDTQIICTTGDKGANNYSKPKVVVTKNGFKSIIPDGLFFYYGLLWSEQSTWGLDPKPEAGDTVYVPQELTLIIDESSPQYIETVINEGKIIFADNGGDMQFHAKYIINRKSELMIGTVFNSYTINLIINLYGSIFDKQLPIYGVKVLACHHCKLEIHGQEKTPTWTTLKTTVDPGATELTLKSETNWEIGDKLVIATTDFDGRHSEQVEITQITHNNSGDVIQFSPALEYEHISVKEEYGSKTLKMQAEVGNLSRSILIQGNPDDREQDQFGGHLMVHGRKSDIRIENVEFTRTGQTRIDGRYTVYLHNLRHSRHCYFNNNSVHHTYARMLTLKNTRKLRVKNNVSYLVKGNNIYMENGKEIKNKIINNLIVSPISTHNLHYDDIHVAGIWISHPRNNISQNHIAGSDDTGIRYDLRRSDNYNYYQGNANDDNHCNSGKKLGISENNVLHSNQNYGLYIDRLISRKNPCDRLYNVEVEQYYQHYHNDDCADTGCQNDYQDQYWQWYENERDYWNERIYDEENPSIQSDFQDYTLYRNGNQGIYAEQLGNTLFNNFILADNRFLGFSASYTGFTEENVVLQNSVIIGQTQDLQDKSINNKDLLVIDGEQQVSISTPYSEGFLISGVEFYNWVDQSTILLINPDEDHYGYDTHYGNNFPRGKTFVIENSSVQNSDKAVKIGWQHGRYNIVNDIDGIFTGTRTNTFIAPYQKYFEQAVRENKCVYNEHIKKYFDNSILCTDIELRFINIGNLEFSDRSMSYMRVFNLNDEIRGPRFNTTEERLDDFTEQYGYNGYIDGYDFPQIYATDYVYNIHWSDNHEKYDWWWGDGEEYVLYGNDWRHLSIYPSLQAQDNDKTIIFRFNFTESRELFDVFKRDVDGWQQPYQLNTDYSAFYKSNGKPNSSAENGCSLGDYYIDQENKTVSVCINNKNRVYEKTAIDMHAIYCRYDCPETVLHQCTEDDGQQRLLSDTSIWPEEPADPENDESDVQPLRKGQDEKEYQYGPPQGGDDVIIPCSWTLTFDVPEFTFGNLIVDGILVISQDLDIAKIRANNIWIRKGKIVIGSQENPWPADKKIEIELYGRNRIKINEKDYQRSIMVHGQLELYGSSPSLIQNRLGQQVQKGDTQIVLSESISQGGWQVGDLLVLGGSAIDGSGYETVQIQSIVDEFTINIEEPVKFYHYGAEKSTVGNNQENSYTVVEERFGTGVDMRGVVGHLSRNIKISGIKDEENDGESQVGAQIIVEHWYRNEQGYYQIYDIDLKGSIKLSGVELYYIGQKEYDLLQSGITVQNTNKESQYENILIEKSTFNKCAASCVGFYHTIDSSVTDNVFYNGYNSFVDIYQYQSTVLDRNVLIGNRGYGYLYYVYDIIHNNYYNIGESHTISIKNNTAQSSKGDGFHFPSTPCDVEQSAFINNEVGNIRGTGIRYHIYSSSCQIAGNNFVYHASQGIDLDTYTYSYGWTLQKNIVVECKLGINLNGRTHRDVNTFNYMIDTYITGMALGEQCPDCYDRNHNKINFLCADQVAVQLLLTTSYRYEASVSSSYMLLNENEFANYRDDDYSEIYEGLISYICGTNRVFKTNQYAYDVQAPHYLRNTTCTNCDLEGKFLFDEPQEIWWSQCGQQDCTGLENVLIQDLTGDFLGTVSSAISDNQSVGYGLDKENTEMKDTCEYYPAWNGFLCERTDLTLLLWESIASDATRFSSGTATLSNEFFNNEANMFRQNSYNKRRNSYASLALVGHRHELTYSGPTSVKMRHKLAERSEEGENDRYIIIEQQYFNSLSIEVRVNGEKKKPFSFKEPKNLDDYSTECGANNYYHSNSTIHFVVTNTPDCEVVLRQTNKVQVNMRLKMTKKEFYADDNNETTFLNRVLALLQVPFDRVRIVGIVEARRRILNEEEQEQQQQTDEIDDNSSIKLLIEIAGDEPGDPIDGEYNPSADFMELNNLAYTLTEAVNSNQFEGASSADYDIFVAKEAGENINEEEYFTQDDIVYDDIDDDVYGSEDDFNDNQNGGGQNGGNNNGGNGLKATNETEEKGDIEIKISMSYFMFALVCAGALVFICFSICCCMCVNVCRNKYKKPNAKKQSNKVQPLPKEWLQIETAQNLNSP